MSLWIVPIVLVLALFGFGFTLHLLWCLAAVLLALWGIGPFMYGRMGSRRSAGSRL
ncbi:hydrophobic protein [Streptomyces sp. NPDC007172]|uniref:hydrophobic protein n=1 Tax=Streptomyces sp. NPDC007172 TaxID=3364776 RepID=UPI0036D10F7C